MGSTAAQDFDPQQIDLLFRLQSDGELIHRKLTLADALEKKWTLRNDTFIIECNWNKYEKRYTVQLMALLPIIAGLAMMYIWAVFILRDKRTKLNTPQKNTLFMLNQLLGELLFTSDDIGDYDAQQLHQYASAFPLCARSGVERRLGPVA